MLLIQVSAPKSIVVLGVGERSVNGRRLGEGRCRSNEGVIARAEKRSDRQPGLLNIDHRSVPNALVHAIAQCLCMHMDIVKTN